MVDSHSQEKNKNTWRYLSFVLMGVLAVGFSFPQAFAHVTNNASHNLIHVLEALELLQADVDDIQNDLGDVKTAVGNTKSIKLDTSLSPEFGDVVLVLLPPEPGKTYSGQILGWFAGGPGYNENLIDIFCSYGDGTGDEARVLADNVITGQNFNSAFACNALYIQVVDKDGEAPYAPARIEATIQYTESLDVTTIGT